LRSAETGRCEHLIPCVPRKLLVAQPRIFFARTWRPRRLVILVREDIVAPLHSHQCLSFCCNRMPWIVLLPGVAAAHWHYHAASSATPVKVPVNLRRVSGGWDLALGPRVGGRVRQRCLSSCVGVEL